MHRNGGESLIASARDAPTCGSTVTATRKNENEFIADAWAIFASLEFHFSDVILMSEAMILCATVDTVSGRLSAMIE